MKYEVNEKIHLLGCTFKDSFFQAHCQKKIKGLKALQSIILFLYTHMGKIYIRLTYHMSYR